MQPSISINVSNAGKKFGKEWIFRNTEFNIAAGSKIAILGLNGSGKSTFLQALTGYISLNEGEIYYLNHNSKIEPDDYYQYISVASPYLELIEDFSLEEMIQYVSLYKPFFKGLTVEDVVELSGLALHKTKYIKLFSSGMKQRLKLTLAILADAPILFLDEPTTNLDSKVIVWYKELIETYAKQKTIIVCSNSLKDEYEFCTDVIQMENLKAISK